MRLININFYTINKLFILYSSSKSPTQTPATSVSSQSATIPQSTTNYTPHAQSSTTTSSSATSDTPQQTSASLPQSSALQQPSIPSSSTWWYSTNSKQLSITTSSLAIPSDTIREPAAKQPRLCYTNIGAFVNSSLSNREGYILITDHFNPDHTYKFPKASNDWRFQHQWLFDHL